MLKSRFRIAGEVLVIATLAGSAAAQSPRAPINTLNDLEAALLDCWVPPPIEQSRPGMQITVLMSFKRNGEMFGQPRIIFQSRDASNAERASYHTAWRRRSSAAPPCPSRRRLETAWPASRSPCASSMIGNGPPTRACKPRHAWRNSNPCHAQVCASEDEDRIHVAKHVKGEIDGKRSERYGSGRSVPRCAARQDRAQCRSGREKV
jgi:hypothetical protein